MFERKKTDSNDLTLKVHAGLTGVGAVKLTVTGTDGKEIDFTTPGLYAVKPGDKITLHVRQIKT